MSENRFFVYLWRFNGIAIAIGALAIASFAVPNLVREWEWVPQQPGRPDNFLVTKPALANANYQLGNNGASLAGTPYLLFELNRWTGAVPPNEYGGPNGENPYGLADVSEGGSGSSSESYQSLVNLLIVDGRDASNRWVFPRLNQIIAWHSVAYGHQNASGVLDGPVTAVLIKAAPGIVGKGGQFIFHGRDTLYYYRLGSPSAVGFFTADSIRSVDQTDANSLLVMYRNRHSLGAARFAVADFRMTGQKAVQPAGD